MQHVHIEIVTPALMGLVALLRVLMRRQPIGSFVVAALMGIAVTSYIAGAADFAKAANLAGVILAIALIAYQRNWRSAAGSRTDHSEQKS
ncbi:hypothetical protein [Burkholderia sp. Ac-20365]|uniref:hypothetical protein n=1 Tax=Burkholderia sp. Ac-20365 TaxID=2703897 RepID=UPI00197CB221|nr:hypothetical protein [Burkholderia sp. Ac-20365]MBN3761107.1 hypothetical protein [Burkholderia sp. Ac-20365]